MNILYAKQDLYTFTNKDLHKLCRLYNINTKLPKNDMCWLLAIAIHNNVHSVKAKMLTAHDLPIRTTTMSKQGDLLSEIMGFHGTDYEMIHKRPLLEYLESANISSGLALYCSDTKSVLIVKEHNGKYGLPKGRVEKITLPCGMIASESFLETALRELTEETGYKLDCASANFLLLRTITHKERLIFIIVMETNCSDLKQDTGAEHSYEWMPVVELQERMKRTPFQFNLSLADLPELLIEYYK